MDRGVWWAMDHGVTKSRTQLTDTFIFQRAKILAFERHWVPVAYSTLVCIF